MGLRARVEAVSRVVVWGMLGVLVVGFVWVQWQERVMRGRAERLLADFQGIRLHESTWGDAQGLMSRWGAWGSYVGECTARDCDYTIRLGDAVSAGFWKSDPYLGWRVYRWGRQLYLGLGGKYPMMQVRFLVQDGTIWRSGVSMEVYVPPHTRKPDNNGEYLLLVSARASDSLRQRYSFVRQRPVGPSVLGDDDQLEQHPNYKAGRPGGCFSCLEADVTFTPAVSGEELRKITGFDFSCVTRLSHCVDSWDLLPVAREWDLYPSSEDAEPVVRPEPTRCGEPLFAVVRDAPRVLLVEVLSVKNAGGRSGTGSHGEETATVRVVKALKGENPPGPGDVVEVQPYPFGQGSAGTATLVAGRQYIWVPALPNDSRSYESEVCRVFEDSGEAEEEVRKGFAQNDLLRSREEFGGMW